MILKKWRLIAFHATTILIAPKKSFDKNLTAASIAFWQLSKDKEINDLIAPKIMPEITRILKQSVLS